MTLANVFYTMGIILMTLIFITLVILVIGVFYIKKKIDEIHKMVEEKIDEFVRPAEAALSIGSTVASTAIDTFKNITRKKKK